VQRGFSNKQAMLGLEQAVDPSAFRAQIRQPSVHSIQLAGKPLLCTADVFDFGAIDKSAA